MLEQYLTRITSCQSIADFKTCMSELSQDFGFSSYNFLDIGNPHIDVPFYLGTTGPDWENDYRDNGFVHVDACVKRARRTNTPFTWDDELNSDQSAPGPKKGQVKLMEAATDHGFKNGLVVPFHFRDKFGQPHSSLCSFFWKDRLSQFNFVIKQQRHDLQILVIYWVQHAVDVISKQERDKPTPLSEFNAQDNKTRLLSDREIDVLSWAARGKTTNETAAILHISGETVSTHLKNATRKLGASNKTHAVVRAIYSGLIDI